MLAQFFQGFGRRAPAAGAFGAFFGNHLDRAVHAHGEHFFHIRDVGVKLVLLAFLIDGGVHHIRPVAPQIGMHGTAFGMLADVARQAEQCEGFFKRHILGFPAFGQAGAGWFFILFRGLATLDIGPEPARAQGYFLALILAQNPVAALAIFAADGAGIAAFRIVATADEPAGTRGFQMQFALAAKRADARITAVFARRVERGLKGLVEDGENLGNPQLGGLGDRRREIAPELGQNLFVIGLAGAHQIKLFLKIGGEFIADIFAEEIEQEDRDDAAFILGDQAVLVFADIFTVLDGGDDAGIGRGAAYP